MTTHKEALTLVLEMVQNKMYAYAEMYLKKALAQPKEPEKEPESIWIGRGQLREILNGNTLNAYCSSEQDRFADVQLYTTHPQRTWVGLTNEEIEQTVGFKKDSTASLVYFSIAHAIEAKLKEKNT